MDWMLPPDGIAMCQSDVARASLRRESIREGSIVGLDLAKRAFQVHAAESDGGVVFSQDHVILFFKELPKCTVAIRGPIFH